MKRQYGSYHAVFVVLTLMLVGCGSESHVVPISGQVLVDGQPLTYGYVRFIPENFRLSGGAIDQEGRFALTCFKESDGAVLGRHRVEVFAQKPLSPTKFQWLAPKKYSNRNQSGLAYDVTGPASDVVLDLSWDGGKPFIEEIAGGLDESAVR